MPKTTFTYKDWILTVDRKATQAMYAGLGSSSSEDCGCTDCKNYIANRPNIFPVEVKELFARLGIDYFKESEIWRVYKADYLHVYNVYFHFKGTLEGSDCLVSVQDGGFTSLLIPVDERVSIGFSLDNSMSCFDDNRNLVQIEFAVKLPWLLDKAEESKW